MNVALFNRHGMQLLSQTFPAGTSLLNAAATLYHRYLGDVNKTLSPVMIAGRDWIGENVSINQASYKAREIK